MLWNEDAGTICAVWHIKADGSLDTSLGGGGNAGLDMPVPGYDFYDAFVAGWTAHSLYMNADGSFKVLWNEDTGTKCAVWHMKADGSIDTSNGRAGSAERT